MQRKLDNSAYRSERIVIQDDGTSRLFLGPNLQLVDCEVEFHCSPRSVGMTGVTMENCSIRAVKPVRHFDFNDARLLGCTFIGKFLECDFGHIARARKLGEVRNCDFSKAHLDDCRFFGCDLDTLVLPQAWPQFVLTGVREGARELLPEAPTPAQGVFLQVLAEEAPEVVASCVLARTIAKRADIPLEAVAALVEKIRLAALRAPKIDNPPGGGLLQRLFQRLRDR